MIPLSLVALVVCLVAFISDGHTPFSIPISLLGEPGRLGAYRVVLGCLMAVALLFFVLRCRAGALGEAFLSGVAVVLLAVLQGTPNGASGHDGLASTVMVVTSVLSFGIAQRLANRWLLLLTLVSLGACSFLFSENLLIMGVVEGIVLTTAVLAMNLACRPAVVDRTWHIGWRWPESIATPRWWRPGMGAGLSWGMYCLLLSGLSQAFDHANMVAGPAGWSLAP